MGQYFMWVNFDKRQYLGDDASVSDEGLKVIETAYIGSRKTDALSTLLGTVWKGDLVVFLGEHFYDIGEYTAVIARRPHHRSPAVAFEHVLQMPDHRRPPRLGIGWALGRRFGLPFRLTIESYNQTSRAYRLGTPNREVRKALLLVHSQLQQHGTSLLGRYRRPVGGWGRSRR